MFRLPALTAPVFTPMTPNAELDCSRVPEYARLLSECGIRSAFVCGSTGEFASLTQRERQLVLEAWLSAKSSGLIDTVVAHVGSCCLTEAVELASHAAACGADAAAVMPPWYFPVSCVDSVVDLLAKVADACPKLPLFVYHFPALCNSRVEIRRLLRAAKARIPTLAGLKFTDSSVADMADCQDTGLQVVLGSEQLLLPAMSLGVSESIGIGQNLVPNLYSELIDAFNRGDLQTGRSRQRRIDRFFEIVRSSVPDCEIFSAMKAVMGVARIDLGPPRLPLRRLSQTEMTVLMHRLQQENFFPDYHGK